MKTWKMIAVALCAAASASQAQIFHAWVYDGVANGTALGAVVAGTQSTGTVGGVRWNNAAQCVVSNQMQRWTATGAVDESSFITKLLPGNTNGTFQLYYDIPSANFALTAAANGTANGGYNIRGLASNAAYDAGVRFRYEGRLNVTNTTVLGATTVFADADQFQIQVKSLDLGGYVTITNLMGSTVSNLRLGATYDLDANTMQAWMIHNGVTNILHNGTIQGDFALTQIRQMMQSTNGGTTWQPGDVMNIDNITVGAVALPPPPPLVGVIEDWQFNDPNGTKLSGLANSAPSPYGLGDWSGDGYSAYATNGVLHFGAATNTADNYYRNSTLSQSGIATGKFELSWAYTAADVSSSTNSGASCAFGLQDLSSSVTAFLVRLQKQNGLLRLETRVGTVNTPLWLLGTNVLEQTLAVRVVADYDTDTFDVFYTLGGGAEQAAVSNKAMAATGLKIDAIRMSVATGSDTMAGSDFYDVDYLRFSAYSEDNSPQGLYNAWRLGYQPALGVATNMADNPDADALDNLGEYAFGGIPTDGGNIGYEPSYKQVNVGGINYIDYVFVRRSDAAARGLSYSLQLNTDLVYGSWTNDTSLYTSTGTADLPGGEFSAVTNRINTAAGKRFIRTKVDYTP